MKPGAVGLIVLTLIALVLLSMVLFRQRSDGFTNPVGETNERGTFVMYYANWCPHCKTTLPVFKQFMGNGVVKINGMPVRVRAVEEKEIQKGVDPEVRGYPTFIYSDSAGKVTEFSGPRTESGFMEFLKEQILS